jgi:GH25 family lysozyme M1 (1,4-beta-N-acetylmuramidase)
LIQAAGLYRSAYHFAQPASSSGTAQANYFIGAVNAVGGFNDSSTYQLVLDLEDSQVRPRSPVAVGDGGGV